MFKRIRRVLVLAVFIFAGYKAYRVHQDFKQVMTYQPMVREILSEKDTPANEELVLAMIYTETKGKEGDVMQSSESASGSTNTINDNASSIRQGVQTLTDNLYLAQNKGVDVWTAVQAYNFGPAYIDFIAQNGKENTLALAKQYSRDTVAPLLGNTTGKTYSYIHPISIFHGAELYVNGGNYYYSRQVQLNLYIIKCFTLFSTSG
ncbi:cell wall hydrolase Pmp23 [Streptococcus pneumoniae]|nr:cell wall hydrolase Pmp23 [Streptococcus pneumoniae]